MGLARTGDLFAWSDRRNPGALANTAPSGLRLDKNRRQTGVEYYILHIRLGDRDNGHGFICGKMAEASGGRTHRRQDCLPPAGFEDRDDHRTACASVLARPRGAQCSADSIDIERRDPLIRAARRSPRRAILCRSTISGGERCANRASGSSSRRGTVSALLRLRRCRR
jgi:hypothetical protein